MEHNIQIVLILTMGFAIASLLGYLSQRIKLPSILGYLLAGYMIGPYSPGFVADKEISEQLAGIGVILMLFSVGLHFKLEDLIKVKHIAIPGAFVQTFVSATAATVLLHYLGWTLTSGIIMGFAIGVASTVVLVRILTDYHLLATLQGHISVGWLIVEDLFTVAGLVLLPILAVPITEDGLTGWIVSKEILFAFAKFIALIVLMFTWGHKVVSYILTNIARLHSHELFTAAVLALVFTIATGSYIIFGTSIALGAFIAGMVIGKTSVRHQAAANALPLKDMFSIFFFLSVGMLFDPIAIIKNFNIFIGLLGIILILKPLAAYLFVLGYGFSFKIGLTIALALAQIGEFSFILAQEATGLGMLPDDAYDILVACAIVSISLNPILFQLMEYVQKRKQRTRPLKYIRAKLLKESPHKLHSLFDFQKINERKVIVVGFGPIGRHIVSNLKAWGFSVVVIEQNIDIVSTEENKDLDIIFGDATMPNILDIAKINTARMLVITTPKVATTVDIIHSARHHNPYVSIVARIRYYADIALMEDLEVAYVCCEKEAANMLLTRIRNLTQYMRPITKSVS